MEIDVKGKYDQCFEANRARWNAMAKTHATSGFYDVPGFLAGNSSLREIERDRLGGLVKGKKLLHLQCHNGQDTLSWTRLGAEATGTDFSPEALTNARGFAKQTGLEARFIELNSMELPGPLAGEQFDFAVATWGVFPWLPDVSLIVNELAKLLKPGGALYIAEFHPVLEALDWDRFIFGYPYFNSGPTREELSLSYTGDLVAAKGMEEYFWNHSLSEFLNACLQAGLRIAAFEEYDYSPWNCFPNLVETGKDRYQFKGYEGKIPMAFELLAEKPA